MKEIIAYQLRGNKRVFNRCFLLEVEAGNIAGRLRILFLDFPGVEWGRLQHFRGKLVLGSFLLGGGIHAHGLRWVIE